MSVIVTVQLVKLLASLVAMDSPESVLQKKMEPVLKEWSPCVQVEKGGKDLEDQEDHKVDQEEKELEVLRMAQEEKVPEERDLEVDLEAKDLEEKDQKMDREEKGLQEKDLEAKDQKLDLVGKDLVEKDREEKDQKLDLAGKDLVEKDLVVKEDHKVDLEEKEGQRVDQEGKDLVEKEEPQVVQDQDWGEEKEQENLRGICLVDQTLLERKSLEVDKT